MELTSEQQQQLTAPFPIHLIEVKPGATSKDKSRALALAYADARSYQQRLDEIVGALGWSVTYRRISDRALVCRLTVGGVAKEDLGECSDPNDPNFWTIASAQAFKRACAAFGLGRYLYSLPRLWADYDQQRKAFTSPRSVVEQMYRQAGLLGQPPRSSSANGARRDQGNDTSAAAPASDYASDDERAALVARLAQAKKCDPSAFDRVPLNRLRELAA